MMINYWEYCILTALETAGCVKFTISYSHKMEVPSVNGRLTVLSEMGRNGWELVSVKSVEDGINEFYFKRPIGSFDQEINRTNKSVK